MTRRFDQAQLLVREEIVGSPAERAFTNTAGELRYEQIDGNTYILADTNGDGVADLMIGLDGAHALTTSDFII